ncbi:MAG: zinc protease [Cyclobacteriaceae bacterium]|jgi:zinc protease
MKNLVLLLSIVFIFGCSTDQSYETKTITENGYTYETVTGDPMKTRIYTLDNGLKVYLSDYKNEPRAQVFIAVKAGSKNDPAENTGLAHYLEHMMFKGTEDFGTLDFEAEQLYLDSIEHMFEYYGRLTDPAERAAYYGLIDQVSNEAAKYAIPNEYDKMVSALGAKGTNAYTASDRTVYTNDVPANELSRYLELEGNRFGTITNRLFHTELEAVYEEKNRGLDSDGRKMYEATLAALFKEHTYGTQMGIGTIEHLKNPSITAIKRFFNTYYTPNNVAVCISGDLDFDKTISSVDAYFGDWKPNESLADWTFPIEQPIAEPLEVTVFGPSSESAWVSYRFDGYGSEEYRYMSLISMIMNNSSAGLIDLNLVQKQKVLGAGCDPWDNKDYSVHNFDATPKQNQSLDEVRDLLLGQIELLKKGDFEDWLIPAVIADFKKGKMKGLEDNSTRANDMVMAFTNDISWSEYIQELDKMEQITKEQVVAFANKYYNNNYVVTYKRIGEDPNKQQVTKPQITKLQVNRDEVSDFQSALLSKEVEKLQPVYVDYEKDINKTEVKGVQVLSKVNDENELFSLIYLLDFGSNESPELAQAVQYMEYIGTGDLDAEGFKKELYKLGCDFAVNSSTERTYVVLTGLDENMEASTTLFEQLFLNPISDQEALDKLVDRKLQARVNAKKDKRQILMSGLRNYARYGAENPFTNVLTNAELTNLEAEALIEGIKKIPSMPHRILYYGPRNESELVKFITEYHNIPDTFIDPPTKVTFEEVNTDVPKVFWVDYEMAQSEIVLLQVGQKYNASLEPKVQMFNEYFGGTMNSIVFQEIREAQGLAYAVYSAYIQTGDTQKSDFLFSYLGTQADKQPEAMKAMVNLINDFPESETAFNIAKDAILNKIESERVTRADVIWNYVNSEKSGIDYDIRKDIYEQVKTMTFEDMKAFQQAYIKDKNFTTVMVGSRDKIDFKDLEKYGEVKELSLEEIFGYEITETLNLQ